jgi:hypothetical protein
MSTQAQPQRHPFLDDLAEDVVLTSSVLRGQVAGRDAVLKVVKSGASQYAKQTPTFLGHIDDRSYFEYLVTLRDGLQGSGLVSIRRNAAREVVGLEIAFSPLDVVLSIAAGAREQLAGELDAGLFL